MIAYKTIYLKSRLFRLYKICIFIRTVPCNKDSYLKRIMPFSAHRTLSSEEVAQPSEPEKQTVRLLLNNLIDNYGYWRQKEQ